MITFLLELCRTVRDFPERPAVVDRDGTRVTTYQELSTAAKRVNAWLRNRGIGREDVCAIHLPRSMEYIAARLGIMMCGAASISLEDLMGKDRIEYVIRDSACRVVLDEEKWAEAMLLPPNDEMADPDPHDLAFIIYTSGSTGTPKGAAQEYGVFENMRTGTWSFVGKYGAPEPMNFAEVAPQSFIAGIYTTVGILGCGGTIHEISMAMARDMEALTGYFVLHEIHNTFMPPTMIRLFLQHPEIRLRAASTGGEIVSGVWTDRFDIINVYGPSEFGFPTCLFPLDRDYDNTPIGWPTCGSDIILLDENGHPTDEGAFCIHLPFFRGYIGEERGSFIELDGKEYFMSPDYVRRDPDGKYTVLSRLDDMVKINGNRVDTKEVEAAVKRVLGADFCHVRLYRNNGIKALCAYYTAEKEIDGAEAARVLRDYVPEYMIPGCYVRLEEVPLNANGKLDRKALPEPKGILRTKPYSAPENEIQKVICDAMKDVMDLDEDVGTDDDFFMLGGDSIRAMETLSCCRLPGLSVQMIYEGRTARRISELLSTVKPAPAAAPENLTAAPLNMGQIYLLEQDLKHPGTCMLNLPLRFNLLPGTDPEKVTSAVCSAVQAHPALRSVIQKENGGFMLRLRTDEAFSLPVEDMADEEMEQAVRDFVKPFALDGSPLFRSRLIRGKSSSVLLTDVYHVICDGYSLKKFVDDIAAAYEGHVLSADSCFTLLREEAERRKLPQFQSDMDYFASRYDRPGWDTIPRPDHQTAENADGKIFRDFGFDRREVSVTAQKYGFGQGGIYIAAAALALAWYNGSRDIMFTWTWHGRSDARRMNSVGYFSRDLPISVQLKPGLLLVQLFEEISAQVRDAISRGSISYWEEKGSYANKDLVCLLYQGDVYEYHGAGNAFHSLESLPLPPMPSNNTLDLEILDGKDDFGVLLDYNALKYEQESMERFGQAFCRFCAQIVCRNPNITTVGEIIRETEKG